MKTISQTELTILRDHLLKKPFQFEEVFREVLDHYATAYENGDFTLAETIETQDQIFLNSRIVAMNESFQADVHKALRNQHLSIFANYFKWPKILFTTVFLATFWCMCQYIHQSVLWSSIIFYSLTSLPILIWLYFGIRFMMGKRFLPWTMKNAHMSYLSFVMNWSLQTMLFTGHFYHIFSKAESAFEISSTVTSIFLIISFILLSTTLQLTFKRIRPHIA